MCDCLTQYFSKHTFSSKTAMADQLIDNEISLVKREKAARSWQFFEFLETFIIFYFYWVFTFTLILIGIYVIIKSNIFFWDESSFYLPLIFFHITIHTINRIDISQSYFKPFIVERTSCVATLTRTLVSFGLVVKIWEGCRSRKSKT